MDEYCTMMSRAGAASLAAHCPGFATSCEPDELYGDPLDALVGGFSSEWLQAALLAGHVPHSDAVALAARAYHVWWREVWEYEARETLPEWTDVTLAYRSLIEMLEGFVIEVEEIAESALRAPERGGELATVRAADAARSRRRAAETRRESAQDDNRRLVDLLRAAGRWYGTP